jgi:hypothetical protein
MATGKDEQTDNIDLNEKYTLNVDYLPENASVTTLELCQQSIALPRPINAIR